MSQTQKTIWIVVDNDDGAPTIHRSREGAEKCIRKAFEQYQDDASSAGWPECIEGLALYEAHPVLVVRETKRLRKKDCPTMHPCPECNGLGDETCKTCDGAGQLWHDECETCDGTSYVDELGEPWPSTGEDFDEIINYELAPPPQTDIGAGIAASYDENSETGESEG